MANASRPPRYSVTFPPGGLPPVRGFWSLTLYNEHHFFHSNDLDRYSLGTKNKNLGSTTMAPHPHASAKPPTEKTAGNWLPAPERTSRSTYGPTGPMSPSSRALGPRRRSDEPTDPRQAKAFSCLLAHEPRRVHPRAAARRHR